MKIKFFKLDKNKKYHYTPRYYNEKNLPKSIEITSPIRSLRESSTQNTLNAHWMQIRLQNRNRKNRNINSTMLIVFIVLLLIALYILDFDYSVFLKN